jgi:hypothetical protein
MQTATIALLATMLMWAAPPAERIVVSPNGHFLQYQDGKPFFWLADTAWLMFDKLTDTEIERYLEDRRGKGFTVVQVMRRRYGYRRQRGAAGGRSGKAGYGSRLLGPRRPDCRCRRQ